MRRYPAEPLAIDIYSKAPDERVSAMHESKGDSVTAYNGPKEGPAPPGRPVREMSAVGAAWPRAWMPKPSTPVQFEQESSASSSCSRIRRRSADRETTVVIPPSEPRSAAGEALLRQGFRPAAAHGALHRHRAGTESHPGGLCRLSRRERGEEPFRWAIGRPSGASPFRWRKAQQNIPIDDAKFVKSAAATGSQ